MSRHDILPKGEKIMKGTIQKNLATTLSIIAVAVMIFAFAPVNVRADVQPAISMWVSPSTLNFTTADHNIGDKFNVTVWANTEVNASYLNTYAWQVTMTWDQSLLIATRVGYTNGTMSNFFYGHAGTSVTPVIQNGTISAAETLMGATEIRPPGTDSLCWVEFQILIAPTGNETLTTALNITDPGSTYFLDFDLNPIAETTLYSGLFSYAPAPPDTTPPTIANPSQSPQDPVPENASVSVSANITDAASGVENATLSYTTNNATWNDVAMAFNAGTGNWTGVIPGQVNGTQVWYKITAFDNAGNNATNPINAVYYTYHVVPEYTIIILIVMLTTLAVAVVAYRKKFVKLP